jgi:hypothetical protein
MAYFEDLSEYQYFARHCRPGSKNIGWLQTGHKFEIAEPSLEILELLWNHCKVSIMQARGFHQCDLCTSPPPLVISARNGIGLHLGSAEIRVFSTQGDVYTAPNMIYHYVRTHHYSPPEEFLRALRKGLGPPSLQYFDRLRQYGFEWNEARSHPGDTRESKPVVTGFRFEKVAGRIDVEFPVHLDQD